MRVIVCGCRDWIDRDAVDRELVRLMDRPGGAMVVVHGACPSGADQFASDWVREMSNKWNGIIEEPHPADWSHGRSAGPRRNAKMANIGADLCLAFWDGQSRGTGDMIHAAIRRGIRVEIVPLRRTA